MNLHGIVRGAVAAVNPDIDCTVLRSSGNVTNAAGKQVPGYVALTGIRAQVQSATTKDIERVNNLGIQGVMRTVYLYGNLHGIIRADQTGGDIVKFPQIPGGQVQDWKVVEVKETWPDWCCVIAVLQTTVITP